MTKKQFEMTDEQKELFDALAPLSQKTCLNALSGDSNIDAYTNAGGKGKTKAIKEASASRMLSNVKCVAFLDSMKATAVSDAVMSRDRMLELQTRIANIGNKEIDLMTLESLNELKGSLDVKLKAMNQIAELAGYKAASKHDLTSTDGSMTPKGIDISATPEEAARAYTEMMENK